MADPPKSVALTAELHDYLVAHGTPLDDLQRWLIAETKAKAGDFAGMQIAPEQGAFMTVLTRLLGARQAVEVGTFTGASALAVARGLPPGGRLLCCDVSEEWTAVAREAWQRAGVADRIELRIGPAVDTLRALPPDFVIDLAFVDADKTNYATYYEELLKRLRANGVMLIDNTLWHGAVIDATAQDDSTKAIRAFNVAVATDDRVDTVLLPISDGVTMLRKR